jgi:redox-sensitive bicupin YhaK (pirin superfamily)
MVVAGSIGGTPAPAPPPRSWAADPTSDVAIWTIKSAPGAQFTLPAASPEANRTLYFFGGEAATFGGQTLPARTLLRLRPDVA